MLLISYNFFISYGFSLSLGNKWSGVCSFLQNKKGFLLENRLRKGLNFEYDVVHRSLLDGGLTATPSFCSIHRLFLKAFGLLEERITKHNMNELSSERSKPWNMYTDSPNSPPQIGGNDEGPWKNFGTSMNAISFGFVATAVLISMFLIMAIFEHLFRPNASFPLPQHATRHSPEDSRPMHKLKNSESHVQGAYASDFSVLMPGQEYPTYIAHSAPLPCSREGVHWPNHHQHNYVFP